MRSAVLSFCRVSQCTFSLSTQRYVSPEGALLDEMLLACGLAPLLQADLRVEPHLELHATDASNSSAGARRASVSPELWRSL